MYKLITKSERNWVAPKSGDMNKLNTDWLFSSFNKFGFPKIASSDFEPGDELIPFHLCKKKLAGDRGKTVHFYLDDYKFEQVWSRPLNYVELFKHYNGIIGTTYSIWSNLPYALSLFNMYRNRWVVKFYQTRGVKVLIDVLWSDRKSWEYCFAGIQRGTACIVSTLGCKNLTTRRIFIEGFAEFMKRVAPKKLYVYGEKMPLKFDDYIEVVKYYPTYWQLRRDEIKKKKAAVIVICKKFRKVG